MKYKIHEKYPYDEFWTRSSAPKGFRTARNCANCGKASVARSGPEGITWVCNETTEYTGVHEETNCPRGYSRQPFYGHQTMTCDEHKFKHEMEKEEQENATV